MIIAREVQIDARVLADQVAHFEYVAAADPAVFRECALKMLVNASDRLADLVARNGK